MTEQESEALFVRTLPGGAPQRAGWFRVDFVNDRWEWSPQAARIFGYRWETVQLTGDLMRSHEHPDNRELTVESLTGLLAAGVAFTARRRIVDTEGRVRQLVVVGDGIYGDDGVAVGARGVCVDVTAEFETSEFGTAQFDTAEVDRADFENAAFETAEKTAAVGVVSRESPEPGVVAQCTGMLMLLYRISAESAAELLRWRSQETGAEMPALAERIVADFLGVDGSQRPGRHVYDRLLLSAHLRLTSGR